MTHDTHHVTLGGTSDHLQSIPRKWPLVYLLPGGEGRSKANDSQMADWDSNTVCGMSTHLTLIWFIVTRGWNSNIGAHAFPFPGGDIRDVCFCHPRARKDRTASRQTMGGSGPKSEFFHPRYLLSRDTQSLGRARVIPVPAAE